MSLIMRHMNKTMSDHRLSAIQKDTLYVLYMLEARRGKPDQLYLASSKFRTDGKAFQQKD